MSRLKSIVITLTLFVAVALAQTGSFTIPTSSLQYMGAARSVVPYSAEQVSETVQTLADGTHITRTMPATRMYRDSQGRMRTERQLGMSMNGSAPSGPAFIEIRDPVEGVAYILDTQAKVAHRVKMQPLTARPALTNATPPPATPPPAMTRPEMSSASLGTQSMEGLLVEGMRTTMTYPVGAMGNDRPLVTTMESWVSRELGVGVLTTSNNPRSGVSTTRLTNISRAEPDVSLFHPPADYTIVDATEPNITIHYGQ